jgi:hypothetical protein
MIFLSWSLLGYFCLISFIPNENITKSKLAAARLVILSHLCHNKSNNGLTISTVIRHIAILNPSNGKPIFVFAFIFAGNPEPLPVKSELNPLQS